jgi:hypothetical protein
MRAAILVFLIYMSSAQAQTPPAGDMESVPSTPASPPANGKDSSDAVKATHGDARATLEACRANERGSGLRGEERRAHIIECVKKVDPHAAARMVCHDEGLAKGLSDDALRNYVRSCWR